MQLDFAEELASASKTHTEQDVGIAVQAGEKSLQDRIRERRPEDETADENMLITHGFQQMNLSRRPVR